ncbi:collagen binding domain-containing protein [Methanobrevibacter sp.]|uniref:MSCRAMM family protein n=1 Tax=Methanobrevibacter sp. TaxID=66852 RepID=UPI00386E89D3
MKYRKIIMVSLLLLAILTIGAVSASDSGDDLAATQSGEDDFAVSEIPAQNDEILSFEDTDVAVGDDEDPDDEFNPLEFNHDEIITDEENENYDENVTVVSLYPLAEPTPGSLRMAMGEDESVLIKDIDNETGWIELDNGEFRYDVCLRDISFDNLNDGDTFRFEFWYGGEDPCTRDVQIEKGDSYIRLSDWYGDEEEDSFFDVNSDLITFRELVELRYSRVGDNATGILVVRDKNSGEVYFRKNVSEMEYNYQMKGYKFDQYDGYVIFKEDLNNTETGTYDLVVSYEDGDLNESVETTVHLDYISQIHRDENDEFDFNMHNETLMCIHVFEVYDNGSLVISWAPEQDEDDDEKWVMPSYMVINITENMLGNEIEIPMGDFGFNNNTVGSYEFDARYASFDDFNFRYVEDIDDVPEECQEYIIGEMNGQILYLEPKNENDHYNFYWKNRYLNEHLTIVDNTKFRMKIESSSLLDKNGRLLVYCPIDSDANDTCINLWWNEWDLNYWFYFNIGDSRGKYFEISLDNLTEIDTVGDYKFILYKVKYLGSHNDEWLNLLSTYDYTFENPFEFPGRAIIGTNDFYASTVLYLVVPNGTEGRVVITGDEETVLFNDTVDNLNVLTEKQQIDYQFYGEEGVLNRYYILDSQLDWNVTEGTYNLSAYFDEENGRIYFDKSSEVRFVERKIIESDGASIELFDYDDHCIGDEEDIIAVVTAEYFSQAGTICDPSQDEVIIEVTFTDEEGNDRVFYYSLEEDEDVYAASIYVPDDGVEPGPYEVTVRYYYNGEGGNSISLSANMTFYRDGDDGEDGPLESIEFYIGEGDDEDVISFERGDNVEVAYLMIPENDGTDVIVTFTRNYEPFATVATSDIEPAYDESRQAYKYPIYLDLTQLEDKDIFEINVDCFDEDNSLWTYAVEVTDANVLLHGYYENVDYYVFYGNITTGDLNDPEMMGPRPNGMFIEFSVPDRYDVSQGSIVVSDDESTLYNKSFDEFENPAYNYEVLGQEYIITLDEFDLMTLPENSIVTVNLNYGSDSLTFKRVRIGDYVYKINTPDDIARLYYVDITDNNLSSEGDTAVSIVATDEANRQSIYIDVGAGQFNVYVDDVKVEGLGGNLLYNWIHYSGVLTTDDDEYLDSLGIDAEEFHQLDEDEKVSILGAMFEDEFGSELELFRMTSFNMGCPELYLSATDLNIDASGTYNIKVTHVPGEPEEGEIDDYIVDEEILVIEKNVTVKITKTAVLTVEDDVMTYGDNPELLITLADEDSNPIANALVYVNNTLGVYKYKTDSDGVATVPVKLKPGEYEFTISYEGNNIYDPVSVDKTVVVNKIGTVISLGNVTVAYRENGNYTVGFADIYGNAISGVTLKVNNSVKVLKYRTDENGVANVPVTLKPGEYAFTVSYDGNAIYEASEASGTVFVNKATLFMDDSDVTVSYKDGFNFTVALTDVNGNPVSGITVKINNTVKVLRYRSNADGIASAPITLKPGTYPYTISFEGNDLYEAASITKTLIVEKAIVNLEAANTEVTYQNGNVTARLTDADGNAIVGATVKFTTGTSTYRYHTDSNGVASAPVKLKPGEYNYTISFDETSVYGSANTTASVKVNKVDTILTADDIDMTFQDGTNYTARLTDINGNAIAGVIVKVNNTVATYKYKTDAEGYIHAPIKLRLGEYAFNAFIEGSDIYNPCNVTSTVVITR